VYDNLAYDEEPLLHCLEPTQHSWVLDPNYIKAQVRMVRKATQLPPWSLPVRLQNYHLASQEPIPSHPKKWPFCALWVYLLGVVNRMARIIGIDKPHDPTLSQPEIEWSPLPTLHRGSGGRYEVAPLMAPKTITPWAQALLHRWVRFNQHPLP
jgi:hypothetical protein